MQLKICLIDIALELPSSIANSGEKFRPDRVKENIYVYISGLIEFKEMHNFTE